jgi:Family of unknown function (DUF6338)
MLPAMPIPSAVYGLAVLLILVIPGTVYAAVRTAVGGRGPYDNEVTTRILWAILASAVFVAAYLLALGEWLVNAFSWEGIRDHPRRAGAIGLVLGIAVPSATAFVIHGRPKWMLDHLSRLSKGHLYRRLSGWLRPTTGYESTPTAWDWAAPNRGGTYVRVRIDLGKWVGGWFGDESFLSTYPESRDIFIERQHAVGPDGKFGNMVEGSAGVWLSVESGYVVEWVSPSSDQPDATSEDIWWPRTNSAGVSPEEPHPIG